MSGLFHPDIFDFQCAIMAPSNLWREEMEKSILYENVRNNTANVSVLVITAIPTKDSLLDFFASYV